MRQQRFQRKDENMHDQDATRETITVEEDIIVMAEDPLPDKTIEEMWYAAGNLKSTQDLVDAYAVVHNKFWWIEDEMYDYPQGSEGHEKACVATDAWGELMDHLEERLIQTAKSEGLMEKEEEYPHSKAAQIPIMEQYGYWDGRGWWIEVDK